MIFSHVFKAAALLAVLGGAAYGVWRWRGNTETSNPITSMIVTREDLSIRATISGMIESKRSTWIIAPYNGYVKKLFVKIGEQVKAGQAIVTVSPDTAGPADESYPLRSPFAGTVMDISAYEGEIVSDQVGGTNQRKRAVVRIDDISETYVTATAPEIDYPKLKVGQAVEVKATAIPEKIYHGHITIIPQSAQEREGWDRSKVEFRVRAQIVDADRKLRPGMSVIADVIIDEAKQVMALRHEYIERDKDKFYVTTSSGERKQVILGLTNDEFAEVKSGIKAGDSIQMVDFLAIARKNAKAGKAL